MNNILGTTDYGLFITLFLFAIVGIVISLLLQANNRTPTNPTTPYKFDFAFLIMDNWKRVLVDFLILFCAIRFYPDLFGKPISPFLALVCGLGFDKVIQMFKKYSGILQVDRSKIVKVEDTIPPHINNK